MTCEIMTVTASARSATVAAVAVCGAMGWLALNVAFNYGGNVTGLFYTGADAAKVRDHDLSAGRSVAHGHV